jgi:hypothetical protein
MCVSTTLFYDLTAEVNIMNTSGPVFVRLTIRDYRVLLLLISCIINNINMMAMHTLKWNHYCHHSLLGLEAVS